MEESKLYVSADYLYPKNAPFDLGLGHEWALLEDFFSASWYIMSWNIVNQPITILEQDVTVNGTVDLNGSKGEAKTISVNGTDYVCREFIVTFDFNETGDYVFGELDIEFSTQRHYYFADGVGLVKDVFDPVTITVDIPFYSENDFEVNGTEAVLVDYYIEAE